MDNDNKNIQNNFSEITENERIKEQIRQFGSKMFLKDVVYIMSIIFLAITLLLMVVFLPQTIKSGNGSAGSLQTEIDSLKKMIEKNADYINSLQGLLNSAISSGSENKPLQFSGIELYKNGENETKQSIALQDINSDMTEIAFYYWNKTDEIIDVIISAPQTEAFATKIVIDEGSGKFIHYIEFSYSQIAKCYNAKEGAEKTDLLAKDKFFILCRIKFENGYEHLIYIIGTNETPSDGLAG